MTLLNTLVNALIERHDVWSNNILYYVLPTNQYIYKCKLCAIFSILIVFTAILCIHDSIDDSNSSNTQRQQQLALLLFLAISTAASLLYYYRYVLYCLYFEKQFQWMDPRVVASENRLEMKVHTLRLYSSTKQARIAALQPNPVGDSPNIWLLDSLESWKFQLFDTVQDALHFMKKNENEPSDGWLPIKIPKHWMLDTRIDDIPIYTNQKYPFYCQPPFVPHKNPTGIYKLEMSLEDFTKQDWTITTFDDDSSLHQYTVMIHGIESAAYIYWNYEYVGFMKDSRLPSEFVVNPKPSQKNNVLHIVVIRWSDGSYLEDQDQWWFAGIHRSVELKRYPNIPE